MFPLLFRHVRFFQLTYRFFDEIVCACDLVMSCEEGRKKVDEITNLLISLEDRRFDVDASLGSVLRVNEDAPRTPVTFICVGGHGGWSGKCLESLEVFNPVRSTWRLVAGEKQLADCREVVCVGVYLFLVGGNISSDVDCLNLASGKWSEPLASLQTARFGHALVVLDGKFIYAIGGKAKSWHSMDCESSVERFDILKNEWTEVASLWISRYRAAAVVYAGQIFVVGGYDGDSTLDSCERYDPVLNKWNRISPMLNKRQMCGAAVVGNYLYAIGGRESNKTVISECERYNFSEDKWEAIEPLSAAREGLGVAAVGHRIFAIGGKNAEGILDTVEVFDPATGKWTRSASLNRPRHEI